MEKKKVLGYICLGLVGVNNVYGTGIRSYFGSSVTYVSNSKNYFF